MNTLVLCLLTLLAADDISHVNELGPVRVTTTLSPAQPTIGDEVVLTIQVRAESGVDVLMPEFGEALSRYTILDFVPKQRVEDDGATVYSQRYTLQSYLSGKQSIPPILIEFVDHRPGHKPAPEDMDAYEILTDRLDFEVQSVLPTGVVPDLNPPLGKLELPTDPGTRRRRYLALGGLALTLLLSALGWALWRARRRRVLQRDPYDVARERLDKLLTRRRPEAEAEIEDFYVELSAIIRRYLEDRFLLRAPELTTEEFLSEAGTSGALTHDHQQLLRDFLRHADLVKFAGVHASEQEIDRSTQLAIQFLEETRSRPGPSPGAVASKPGTRPAKPPVTVGRDTDA